MINTIVAVVAIFVIGIAALLLSGLAMQMASDRKQRRLSDEYMRLVETHGFRSKVEGEVCIQAVIEGNYEAAIALLRHGR